MNEATQLLPKVRLVQFVLKDPHQPVTHILWPPYAHVPQYPPPLRAVQTGVSVLAEGVVLDGARRDLAQPLLYIL